MLDGGRSRVELSNGESVPDSSTISQPQTSLICENAPLKGLRALFHGRGLFDPLGGREVDIWSIMQLEADTPLTPVYGVSTQETRDPLTSRLSEADYQRLAVDFPFLLGVPSLNSLYLQRLFQDGLDYLNVFMPFLHGPTLNAPSLPTYLIVAICSLGCLTSSTSEAIEAGTVLQDHLTTCALTAIRDEPQLELSKQQALVISSHASLNGSTTKSFEMADIVHSIVVAISQNSKLLRRSLHSLGEYQDNLEIKWKNWIETESLTRLAHCIFVSDVENRLHFQRTRSLQTKSPALPLPCPETLWAAETVAKWRIEVTRMRTTPRTDAPLGLQATLRDLLSHDGDQRTSVDPFSSGFFSMYILIQNLVSEVLELDDSAALPYSKSICRLKKEEVKIGLTR